MKTVALGTKLTVADDSENATPVGNLTQIGVPGPTKPEIDVTDFDSTAAEFLAGLPDNGELPLTGFFNSEDDGQAILLADALSPDQIVREFVVTLTKQALAFTFQGWVKSFVTQAPGPNDAYGFDSVIRITGAVQPSPISEMGLFSEGTPTVMVELDKPREIALTLRAIRLFREKVGVLEVDDARPEQLAIFIWAAMHPSEQTEITVEDIELMIHPGNMVAIAAAVQKIKSMSHPDPDPANPTVAVPAAPEN